MHKNSFFDPIENLIVYQLIAQLADNGGEDFTFIEVGAFDGTTANHIHPHATNRGWKGLVIEPSPPAFSKLKLAYAGHPQVIVVQTAVGDKSGIVPFYWVEPDKELDWIDMMSSTDKAVILAQKSLVPNIAERIKELEVPIRTISDLCTEHHLARVDLIKIDAEGHDDDVLRSIDFKKIKPVMIMFEHKLIPTERLHANDEMLTSFGYERIPMWADTVYVTGGFARDECVMRIIASAPSLWPVGRDPTWGNGNWFAN